MPKPDKDKFEIQPKPDKGKFKIQPDKGKPGRPAPGQLKRILPEPPVVRPGAPPSKQPKKGPPAKEPKKGSPDKGKGKGKGG